MSMWGVNVVMTTFTLPMFVVAVSGSLMSFVHFVLILNDSPPPQLMVIILFRFVSEVEGKYNSSWSSRARDNLYYKTGILRWEF